MDKKLLGHRFYCGKTGSGKTILVIQHLKEFLDSDSLQEYSLLIVNPKDSSDWNNLLKPIRKPPKIGKDNFRYNWIVNNDEHYLINDVLKDIYEKHKKKVVIIFDEGQSVDNHSIPYAWNIYHQGREKEIMIWALTQRPTHITRSAITQAEKLYIFSVIGRDDITLLDGFMEVSLKKYIRPEVLDADYNVKVEGKRLDAYHYLQYDVKTGVGLLCKPATDYRGMYKIPRIKPKLNKAYLLTLMLPIIYIIKG